jgi:transcriptional regulator with XRE-family HTH domain
MSGEFDLCGALRRIRRRADMSQRELAAAARASVSAVAHAEAGSRDLPVGVLARAAALAGLRLAIVDERGAEVDGMTDEGARDRSDRRLPAHLDTIRSDERPGYYEARKSRPQPTYTFDRNRADRDERRRRLGTPADHDVPQWGDSPEERSEVRLQEAWQRREEERRRWLDEHRMQAFDPGFTCRCPPLCDELDDRSGAPVHAADCPCRCDVA